jgi:hypothetical protein
MVPGQAGATPKSTMVPQLKASLTGAWAKRGKATNKAAAKRRVNFIFVFK